MGLELDRIGAGIGDRIDEGMRHPERAVMRLRDLRDDQGSGCPAQRRGRRCSSLFTCRTRV